MLTEGGRWFAPPSGQAFIPLEFADAAFRYGHGQIRHTYRLVAGGPAVPLFPDLVGFGPLPADRRLDLAQVFDLRGRPPAQRAKRIDARLAASLIGLPERVTGAVESAAYRSLAVRDLLRGGTTGLPSGEAVARLIGVVPLTAEEVGMLRADPTSYLSLEPDRTPTLPTAGPAFGPADLLTTGFRGDPPA